MIKEKSGWEKRKEKMDEIDSMLLYSHDEVEEAIESAANSQFWAGLFLGCAFMLIIMAILSAIWPNWIRS